MQGLGVTLLPCCYGDRLDGLRLVVVPIEELVTSLWILTHKDLRRSALVRAFIDFYLPRLRGMKDELAGRPASWPK